MRCFRLSLTALPVTLALSAPVCASEVNATDWLLQQVRIGESSQRYDLVTQSLDRLMMIAPDDPEVILARIRMLLRQGDMAAANQLVEKSCRPAPDAAVCQTARMQVALNTPEGHQGLQQARLLASGGQYAAAVAAYDKLWHGMSPPLEFAPEYWRTVARLPGQVSRAITALQAVNQRYPNSAALQTTLISLLFSDGKEAQAYALLTQMAADGATRDSAASLWMTQIQRMPLGEQSVAALQRYIQVFHDAPQAVADAQALLQTQQAQLADPQYRARSTGLAQAAAGNDSQAQPLLQQTLRQHPNDAETLGALAQTYSQQGDRPRAIALFERAIAADPHSDQLSKWQSLLKTNRYWLLIKQGDEALAAHQYALAQQKYRQAQALDGENAYGPIGLGDVAAAQGDLAQAEQSYRLALRRDPLNGSALRKLVSLYQQQSPDKVLAYLQQLPAAQRRAMQSSYSELQSDALQQQAAALAGRQAWGPALEKLNEAQRLTPDDVWLNYRLAGTLVSAGQPERADALMQRMDQRFSHRGDQVYARALYLSSRGQPDQAQAVLRRIPAAQWSDGMRALDLRLQAQHIVDHANGLRDGGHEQQAIAYLQRQPATTAIDLTLADWALARDDYADALKGYQGVLTRDPQNSDARLGVIETRVAQGDRRAAEAALRRQPPQAAADDLNVQRRIANAWAACGDPQQARRIFDSLLPTARRTPGMAGALVLRDDARLAVQSRQTERAQNDLRSAMVATGISETPPQDNDAFTRLTRTAPQDDWLKRSVRADGADLYRQQEVRFTLEHDYWGSSGSGGYSDLKAHTTMLQADMPLYDGRLFLRGDLVNMDAGRLSGGAYQDKFGSCYVTGCPAGEGQLGAGTSLAVGWQNSAWQMDIGTTPIGMKVVDWVGGIAYSGSWDHIGWTLEAHRRPVSSSLLSMGGQRDPHTGTVWGGVRRNGVALSGSYDRGGPHGLWGSLSADYLEGKNVENNSSMRWMGGYYYKLINEDNRRVSVGLSNMLWHYDKDLSGYTLGQGGYYSPQQYVSFGIPVNYRQRTENWSWELGGSVSWSYANTSRQARYPLQNLVDSTTVPDYAASDDGGSSNGFGYTLRAIVERRLSSHWFVGAGVDIQQAKDYTPSHALIYVRYSMQGWQGDMDLPPQPLRPYADF
ncbi:cellulose biosynthesis protein BcsC [Edwardsiella piscicida]|uniref:cellulose synthase complex outer membrane protein BcsC n=1 Tax=Edwardsiella piscicida TaxID=1263550 RepID=UPI00290BBAE6|nr:cellulose biosynthesis protein BcsC [Edwardsiella piscicida]